MRKQHRQLSVEEVVQLAQESTAPITVSSVAAHFDVSITTARRKLDGGMMRGLLLRDEYDEEGRKLRHEYYRYIANEEAVQSA